MTVSVDFTASEPSSGAGINQVSFLFQPETHGPYIELLWYRQKSHATSVSATARGTVNPRAPAGRYMLTSVSVHDRGGPSTTYYKDGVQASGYAPPPSSDVDWSQHIDVINPAGDSDPPHLASLKVWHSTVHAGKPVVILYRAAADAGDVASVSVYYTAPPDGPTENFAIGQAIPLIAAVGPAVRVIPRAGYGGYYRAHAVTITDIAGNSTTYLRDNGPQPPDNIDVSAADFTVIPYAEDDKAPVLKSLSLRSSHHPVTGDQLALDYRATDGVADR